jgi:hypothetical protein
MHWVTLEDRTLRHLQLAQEWLESQGMPGEHWQAHDMGVITLRKGQWCSTRTWAFLDADTAMLFRLTWG